MSDLRESKVFNDLREFEDYRSSTKGKRRSLEPRLDFSIFDLVLKGPNGRIVETRNYGEFVPFQISGNRKYLLLKKYEDGKVISQLRDYRGAPLWEEETGDAFFAFISNDGDHTVFLKGQGGISPSSAIDRIGFYDQDGKLLRQNATEGLIWARPIIFSDEHGRLIVWTKSIRVHEDGSREIYGPAIVHAFDLSGNILWDYPIKEQGIHDIKISGSGDLVIIGEGEGEMVSGTWQGGSHVYFIDEKGRTINTFPFTYGCNHGGIKIIDHARVVSVFADQNIFLFEFPGGKPLWEYLDPSLYFRYIDVSPVTMKTVAGGYDADQRFYLTVLDKDGIKESQEKIDIEQEPEIVEFSDNGEDVFLEFANKAIVFM